MTDQTSYHVCSEVVVVRGKSHNYINCFKVKFDDAFRKIYFNSFC